MRLRTLFSQATLKYAYFTTGPDPSSEKRATASDRCIWGRTATVPRIKGSDPSESLGRGLHRTIAALSPSHFRQR